MKILLTNDDGYKANGLQALKKVLAQYGTVYTVAPSEVQSGKGCALTTFRPFKAHKIDEYNYHVEGTPVDCVQFAYLILKNDFDLVVSGCNNGYNLSNDIMYSGTCGACFQALIFKKKAIAFSADYYDEPTQVINYAKMVLDYIFEHNLLSPNYYLNVNFHKDPNMSPKGIKITKVHIRHSDYEMKSYDETTDTYIIKHLHDDIFNDDNYDVSAVNNGYISITPMGITTFRDEHYDELKKKI